MTSEPPESDQFVKRRAGTPPEAYESEAAGLRWLAEPGVLPVPRVLEVTPQRLVIERIRGGAATRRGAERFGRGLAKLHASGAPGFGAPWPGFIGPLPMDNRASDDWPTFYAERRVRPFLVKAVGNGAVSHAEAAVIEAALELLPALRGADEEPRRLHGDLWSGNVVWDRHGEAWLIDPAAHGGHRETDLAMLALFGAPYLDTIIGSYGEQAPLDPGFDERVGLHQLHPLLVHAVLFGSSYGAQAATAARRALSLWR